MIVFCAACGYISSVLYAVLDKQRKVWQRFIFFMHLLYSVAKLDHERAGNGTLLNWKFNPSAVQGEIGLKNLIALLDMIVDKKLMHSQFNVITKEQLLAAQADPDKYKNLLVRVAGYSAYFVDLGKDLQRDIIERTEYSFD